MRTYIFTIALAISSSSAFAVNTCDTMPTKSQVYACQMSLVGNAMELSDDYNTAVQIAPEVPEKVKQKVDTEYRSIPGDIQQHCKETDYRCAIKHHENFTDFAYKETSKYGVPDKRLN
jgi:hypothetical protein